MLFPHLDAPRHRCQVLTHIIGLGGKDGPVTAEDELRDGSASSVSWKVHGVVPDRERVRDGVCWERRGKSWDHWLAIFMIH